MWYLRHAEHHAKNRTSLCGPDQETLFFDWPPICFDLPLKLFAELAEAEQCADIELWKKMKNQQKVELYRVLQTWFLHSFTQFNIAPKRFELLAVWALGGIWKNKQRALRKVLILLVYLFLKCHKSKKKSVAFFFEPRSKSNSNQYSSHRYDK